jgi:hypothetical protein
MAALMQASTRIYVIHARKAPFAVVFRRGPSKQVLTIAWDTGTHEFRMGQWFKGRIYEHRCDLSPSGEKLVYFAAKHRAPLFTWTAVSRPPYLTALALWPKGDAWGGGGLFKNERTISLNHPRSQFDLAENFKLPRALSVEPCGAYSGPSGKPGLGPTAPGPWRCLLLEYTSGTARGGFSSIASWTRKARLCSSSGAAIGRTGRCQVSCCSRAPAGCTGS